MSNNPTHACVVVDTNVFIAAALAIKHRRFESPNYKLFEMLSVQDGIECVVSDAILYELGDKLQDPRFGLSWAFIIAFMEVVAAASIIVPIRGLSYPCRDQKDAKFIETAVNGRVDFLITYDRDLLEPEAARELIKRGCAVVTVSDFLFAVTKVREELAPKRGDVET